MKVLLDMDGVLCNFVDAACKLHERPNPFEGDEHLGEWMLDEIWGISKDEFWKPITREFWRNLDWMPDGRDILKIVIDAFGVDNICLFSSPSLDPEALSGKFDWIKTHVPEFSRHFIFGAQKYFLAHPDIVLIDDYDKNVDDFHEHGGHTIQVPRKWNRMHSERTLHWLRKRVKEMIKVADPFRYDPDR